MIKTLLPLILIYFTVQPFCFAKEYKLISCTDKESGTYATLKFNSETKCYQIEASVLRTPPPGEKKKIFSINTTSTGFGAITAYPFVGYDQRAGYNCRTVSVPLLDPNDPERKICAEGMSQLEWMGKYTGGKAEPRNPKSDKKVTEYRDKITKHCKAFDGRLESVWLSIPEPGKACDRIGLDVYEFAFPTAAMFSPSIRLEGLYQSSSTKCEYDSEAVMRVQNEVKGAGSFE